MLSWQQQKTGKWSGLWHRLSTATTQHGELLLKFALSMAPMFLRWDQRYTTCASWGLVPWDPRYLERVPNQARSWMPDVTTVAAMGKLDRGGFYRARRYQVDSDGKRDRRCFYRNPTLPRWQRWSSPHRTPPLKATIGRA